MCQGSDWRWWLDEIRAPIVCHLWKAGLLEDALAELEQVMKYLHSYSDQGDTEIVERLQWSQMNQHFILCDMGRLPEAIQMIQETSWMSMVVGIGNYSLLPCVIKTSILRRVGRNTDVIQLLRRGVAFGTEKYWASSSKLFDLHFYFLLVELAAAWGQAGQPEKALKDAEQAVAACQKDVDDDKVEPQKCTLVHSLTTLSNCLAAVGRNDEALNFP
ncbi:hypothetical protein B0H13DRAFT_1855824 [Mycena leptocephala]|nr:hypothetical protein B0H13DRAFT_1855824 [Mycena leptocephala]